MVMRSSKTRIGKQEAPVNLKLPQRWGVHGDSWFVLLERQVVGAKVLNYWPSQPGSKVVASGLREHNDDLEILKSNHLHVLMKIQRF